MKKIHRFLISKKPTEKIFLVEDLGISHLIRNVLRLKAGEECAVFTDGSDDYFCEVYKVQNDSVGLKNISIKTKIEITRDVTACISIMKKNNFELVVQKLTELGVKIIIPIISDRTIKQSIRVDRLQKISDEALEQSGHSNRLKVLEPTSLENALEKNRGLSSIYFDIEGQPASLYARQDLAEYTFYIGPEGGWGDHDKKLFERYGVPPYSLGKTVLRAETAAIVGAFSLLKDF